MLIVLGYHNPLKAQENRFISHPAGINVSITGNDHFAFKRLGIKGEIRYTLGERHSLGGGMVVNFVDPWDIQGFPERGENVFYDYTLLFSWGPDF